MLRVGSYDQRALITRVRAELLREPYMSQQLHWAFLARPSQLCATVV